MHTRRPPRTPPRAHAKKHHAKGKPSPKRARATHNYADAQSPISSARRPTKRAAPLTPRKAHSGGAGGGEDDGGVVVVRNLQAQFEGEHDAHDAHDEELQLFSSTAFHEGAAPHTPTHSPPPDEEKDNDENAVPVTHTMPVVDDEFDPFFFIKHLPPLPAHHRFRACTLPRKTRHAPKCTLVLDMDETLLHSSLTPVDRYDVLLPVEFNGQVIQVYVRLRPHLDAFLSEVAKCFEVVVFTASQRVYAERLLNVLDPQRKRIKYRQYRESCVEVEGNLVKDLNILGRDLARTIIIDNSIHAFAYHVDNGIPITSWYDDDNDNELLALIPQLKAMATLPDVRPFLRSTYRLHHHVQNAS